MADIAAAVSEHFGFSVRDLRGPRKFRKLAYPRFLFCLLARELALKTFPEIGAYLSRDHTTVIYAERKAREMIEADDGMAAAFLSIQNELTGAE